MGLVVIVFDYPLASEGPDEVGGFGDEYLVQPGFPGVPFAIFIFE